MRSLWHYVETGERAALEAFCKDREATASLCHRVTIEGFEREDIIQEAFLAALTWAEAVRSMQPLPQATPEAAIFAHLQRCKRGLQRHNPRVMTARPNGGPEDELYDDNAVARSGGDIDALVLMLAARSECESERDQRLLELLAEGAGYRPLCQEFRCNKGAARDRVYNFRKRLGAKLYPEEEEYETDSGRR